MGGAAVLIVVAAVVFVGVLLTWYLPPRAHVLTVGDRDYNARAVADRAYYLATTGSGEALRVPAQEATRSLIRQEILLQVAAPLVEEVTQAEVREAIAERLGLGEEWTDEAYATALAAYLQEAPITQRALESIVRAGIIEDRLEEMLSDELPEAGDQMHIIAARTTNRGAALSLVESVRGGADFREAAVELRVIGSEAEIQDLGWYAPQALSDRVAPFVRDLQQGEVSEPVDDAGRVGFEVFYVSERTTDEPYEERVRAQLARGAFNDWLREQEDLIRVELSISDSTADWIRRQVQAALRG
jgi:parvulin-like peptidyl-prolyl isomerase